MRKTPFKVRLTTERSANKYKDSPQWFAMRVTYKRELAVRNILEERGIACFIPMKQELRTVGRRSLKTFVPAIHNLIFVYSTQAIIQGIKSGISHLQYLTFGKSGSKIIVPDKQMQRFVAASDRTNEHMQYFTPGELNLSRGTKIRILGGHFEGMEGVLVKIKGGRERRVVVSIPGVFDLVIASLPPELVEPLPTPASIAANNDIFKPKHIK